MKIKNKIIPTILIFTLLNIVFLFTPVFVLAVEKLLVPFTSQAPEKNWGQPWQDFCEEAVIIMVDHYYSNQALTTIQAKQELLKLNNIKNDHIGSSLDENAKTIISLINNFLPWEAQAVANPDIEKIKTEIDAGRPVIIPVHGKFLNNPHFQNGGPEYHTVIISGYDDEKQEFITQEPGTKFGLDFHYKYDILMRALHDYLPGYQTVQGAKTAIFTSPNLSESKTLDGDNDNLSKTEEIKHGSMLWLDDSDDDGYKDGEEVKNGYSPTIAETKLNNGTIFKTFSDAKVYLLENNTKRHILNEQVFHSHNWHWSNIKIVSEKYLNNLTTASPVSE